MQVSSRKCEHLHIAHKMASTTVSTCQKWQLVVPIVGKGYNIDLAGHKIAQGTLVEEVETSQEADFDIVDCKNRHVRFRRRGHPVDHFAGVQVKSVDRP